jgi:hypothetical protein
MMGITGLVLVGLASLVTFAVSLSRKQAPALAAA